MIAAIALGVAILAAANWIFGAESQAVYRWLLLVLSLAFVLVSLGLRGAYPRHAELMVITAGLATLAIALVASVGALLLSLTGFGTPPAGRLPARLLGVHRARGRLRADRVRRRRPRSRGGLARARPPARVPRRRQRRRGRHAARWPLFLLALGGGVLVAGLRPRRPLPPEPAGYSVERPLASRTGDEITLRVRNDDPPPPR